MFDKLLIANRGEIACRIIATCRRLGIATVAVYSSADRHARHVGMADRAVRIGAAPASESYLNIQAVVDAARTTGAQAVHPGYGFLSENAGFADACAAAGLVFVGPSAAAIRAMGDKAAAKRLAAEAGLPVLPGGVESGGNDADLVAAARSAGFPAMVKPAAGGGGRGMRIVRAEAELPAALAAARREAMASFGDDTLMIEKYVDRPRHIEVQVFGDGRGGAVHLFERDCSVQRRHQKLVEEAPAPGLDPALRAALHEAACALVRATDYLGAGTVEFLVDGENRYWFMEMNTRLQVEHPVTETVTGLDLVEWQLRLAAGEELPAAQGDIRCDGHAIEARLCAEDPAADFAPGTGRLYGLVLPEAEGVRVDAGVREGDEVTVHYDSMIAKIVARGRDREDARTRLSDALAAVRVAGPPTNEAFLRRTVDHPDFRAGGVDTGFVGRHLATLADGETQPVGPVLAVAALAATTPRAAPGPSPWADARGWRQSAVAKRHIALRYAGERHAFVLEGGTTLFAAGKYVAGAGRWLSAHRFECDCGSGRMTADVFRDGTSLTLFVDGVRFPVRIDDPLAVRGGGGADAGSLVAPMPGKVVAIEVAEGDRVTAGAPLLAIEAMKVEQTIRAPADGTVLALPFAVGDRVNEGDELVEFAPDVDEHGETHGSPRR